MLTTDVRDLGEVPAQALFRRQEAADPLPRQVLDVVAPEVLSGERIATIWSGELNRPVAYGGDDLDAFENVIRAVAPPWMAYGMRLMMRSYQHYGMQAKPGDEDTLQTLLGRPMRTYREFVREMLEAWQA